MGDDRPPRRTQARQGKPPAVRVHGLQRVDEEELALRTAGQRAALQRPGTLVRPRPGRNVTAPSPTRISPTLLSVRSNNGKAEVGRCGRSVEACRWTAALGKMGPASRCDDMHGPKGPAVQCLTRT